ncbi:hypothetical protein [Mycobacterium sp.]|uniref:hypothetical protein n=1 Tax=Mycobacterium sp. TaxID=1785 RepID=UPI0033418041
MATAKLRVAEDKLRKDIPACSSNLRPAQYFLFRRLIALIVSIPDPRNSDPSVTAQ